MTEILLLCMDFLNATRDLSEVHRGSDGCVIYIHLYSVTFLDHLCTTDAAVCHQVPPCPLYTQPRAGRVCLKSFLTRQDSNP